MIKQEFKYSSWSCGKNFSVNSSLKSSWFLLFLFFFAKINCFLSRSHLCDFVLDFKILFFSHQMLQHNKNFFAQYGYSKKFYFPTKQTETCNNHCNKFFFREIREAKFLQFEYPSRKKKEFSATESGVKNKLLKSETKMTSLLQK